MERPVHVLAIDLGTSGPKVALVAPSGAITGTATETVPLILDGAGGAEQDPRAWWAAIASASQRTIAASPDTEICAVSVTSQWSGTVPIDDAGTPIGNAIIWMDARGAAHVPGLLASSPFTFDGYGPIRARNWIRLTGGAPSGAGKDPIAHIAWLREERPDVYRQAAKFLEPKDYLNLVLTGRAVASYDSIALHWLTDNRDPDAVTYDETLLEYAGMTMAQLPDLVHATDVVGDVTPTAAEALGIPSGVPVVAGTPDVSSAAIGAGTVSDFAAHLYIGTSSWLTCHVPFKKTDLVHSIASLPAAVPGRWFVADEQETAGKCLDWAASTLFPDLPRSAETFQRLNDIAASTPPGANGVIFLPWLYGERTPVEDATLRGGFLNQSLTTGRDEMVRAVFEGVAYNARWLLETVERFTKRTLDPIAMVGGGAQSELWAQIHADVLDRTILRRDEPLWVNVRGAGMLAHAALGNIAWSDIDDSVATASIHTPVPANKDVYDAGYDTFRRFHRSTRRVYRRINRPD